jgi:primosomal protein N' (replication factor Y)
MGTQMVAKGHHFPHVGFVAVINADIGLSLPDFRASERVLQLLTQAAGRARRSFHKGDPGLVMVQTFSPDQPVFSYLKAHDFTGFLENEIELRQILGYPPFKRLVLLVISSSSAARAIAGAADLRDELCGIASDKSIEILGPAQSPLFKRGKLYRYQLLLKMPAGTESPELQKILNDFMKRSHGLGVRIDADPVSFM